MAANMRYETNMKDNGRRKVILFIIKFNLFSFYYYFHSGNIAQAAN